MYTQQHPNKSALPTGHLRPAQVEAFLDKALSHQEEHAIAAHLQDCPRCQALVAEETEWIAALRHAPKPVYTLSPRQVEEMDAAISRRFRRSLALSRLTSASHSVALVGLVVIGIGLFAWWLAGGIPDVEPGVTPTTAVVQPTPTLTPTAIPEPTTTVLPPATPTPEPTPDPTPTVTSTPIIVAEPHVRGAYIILSGWSPDSQWLAYWQSTDADVANLESDTSPGGMLHLLNAGSGASCPLSQFQTTAWGEMSLIWAADNSLIIRDRKGGKWWQGQPCQPDSFVWMTDPPAPLADIDDGGGLSPDGRWYITTHLQEKDGDLLTFSTYLKDEDGTPITAVTWQTYTTLGDNPLGGEWLTPTQFYIPFAEGGALLLDAARPGQVVNIPVELFGQEHAGLGRTVVAAPGATPDSFYLLLLGGRAYEHIELYHASTGRVELLPYRRPAWPPFSPDYRWLLLRELESNDLWMRPVADVDGEWQLLATEVSNFRWNEELTEVALGRSWLVTWQTFPEGELIGEWSTRPFENRPDGWSPDGRFLVVTGLMTGQYHQALFLFERD